MKRSKTPWLPFLCGALVATVVFLLFRGESYHQRARTEMSHAASLRGILQKYATEHDGKFPLTWKDLPPEVIPVDRRFFRDPITMRRMDWVYFEGYSLAREGYLAPKEFMPIVLVSPLPVEGDKYMAVFADCSAELTDEAALLKHLSEQMQRRGGPLPTGTSVQQGSR